MSVYQQNKILEHLIEDPNLKLDSARQLKDWIKTMIYNLLQNVSIEMNPVDNKQLYNLQILYNKVSDRIIKLIDE